MSKIKYSFFSLLYKRNELYKWDVIDLEISGDVQIRFEIYKIIEIDSQKNPQIETIMRKEF